MEMFLLPDKGLLVGRSSESHCKSPVNCRLFGMIVVHIFSDMSGYFGFNEVLFAEFEVQVARVRLPDNPNG